ncbi:MAG: hypothetical protein WAS72_07395 [Saprospiraceae bacterium]
MYENWHGLGSTYHQRNDSDVEMKINYIGDDFNDKVSFLKVQEIVKNTIDGLDGIIIYADSNFAGKSFNLKKCHQRFPLTHFSAAWTCG